MGHGEMANGPGGSADSSVHKQQHILELPHHLSMQA